MKARLTTIGCAGIFSVALASAVHTVEATETDAHAGHAGEQIETAVPGSDTNASETSDRDHNGMQHDMPDDDQTRQTTQDMNAMDHGDMEMQGGTAPPDARDPHAYSGGYVRGAGKYALPGGQTLKMGDEHNFAVLLVDRLERVDLDEGSSGAYDVQAWFGRNYDRLVLKAEGEVANGRLEDANTELFWGHAVAAYWDTQLGLRHDSGEGPNRNWLALGIQGLAPYWFEIDATAYAGEGGRTALNLEVEYELLLTQRLVLQPRIETDFYGKDDPARGIGNGWSSSAVGLRLRYEFRREFAPYVGVEWNRKHGETADIARNGDESVSDTHWVAGVRFWF